MITAVALPLPLQDRLRDETLRAFPRECCGLLEGYVRSLILSVSKGEASTSEIAHISALHPMRNIALESDRFEIDPAQHIALLQKLRGTERTIIGCYHSHPNGRAEPSERDRASADEEGFLWLIAAINPDAVEQTCLAAFVSKGQSFSNLELVNALPGTAGACGPT
jgi:desampylase